MPAGRALALFRPNDPLRCPFGHAIPNDKRPVIGYVIIECAVQLATRTHEQRSAELATRLRSGNCGALCFVHERLDGQTLVARLTFGEAHHLRDRKLPTEHALEYLGLVRGIDEVA